MRILTAVGVGALVVLCVLRRHDLATAAAAVPPQALGALAALHLCSLVARSEAWRLSLAALVGSAAVARGDPRGQRRRLRRGRAGGPRGAARRASRCYAGSRPISFRTPPTSRWPTCRSSCSRRPAPRCCSAPPARGGRRRRRSPCCVGARLAAGRRATRGLAVLADVRRRAALALLVGCIVGCGLARVWLVLAVAHLDASPAAAALAFAALGIFGLLPLGPSAPPGALLVVSGGAGAGALAAGLALSATSLAAVALYGAIRGWPRPPYAPIGPNRGSSP